jgi:DNA primase
MIRAVDIVAVIGSDTHLTRVANTNGGEHAGPCPFCGGTDRFRVWPNSTRHHGKGRFWCRRCDESGDAIDYVRERDGLSYAGACGLLGINRRSCPPSPARVRPATDNASRPSAVWRTRAERMVEGAADALWSSGGERPLAWLRQRGLGDATIRGARLGLNANTRWEPAGSWGVPETPGRGRRVWLPSGIVIPWYVADDVQRLQVRRLEGEPRYVGISGSGTPLYNGHRIKPATPVVLTEGVFDALVLRQEAGDICTPVATGSSAATGNATWTRALATASVVLIAFDADEPGDKGAARWLSVLSNAHRWRPYWGDVCDMHRDAVDLRAWIQQGIDSVASG